MAHEFKAIADVNWESGTVQCRMVAVDKSFPPSVPFAAFVVNGLWVDVYFPQFENRLEEFAKNNDNVLFLERVKDALKVEFEAT